MYFVLCTLCKLYFALGQRVPFVQATAVAKKVLTKMCTIIHQHAVRYSKLSLVVNACLRLDSLIIINCMSSIVWCIYDKYTSRSGQIIVFMHLLLWQQSFFKTLRNSFGLTLQSLSVVVYNICVMLYSTP